MFRYYLLLAAYSFKRSRLLTALMILAIGLGIGASMTMITVLHVMSGDPLPGRSAQLYVPVIDPHPVSNTKPKNTIVDGNMTWTDAMYLLHAARADRQAAMAAGALPVRPAQASLRPFFESGHYVTADFFPMFGTPFRTGAGWSAQDDENHVRVVVLNADLNRKLFGNTPSIGRNVRLKNTDFRVIGVLDDWQPQPTFYAQIDNAAFGSTDQFFIPLQTAQELNFEISGRMWCWGNGGDGRASGDCSWLQFWVELDSAGKAHAYQNFLADYWRDQQAHGRFPRPVNAQLYGLMDWLSNQHVVPGDLRLQLWLALGFLGVCMLNIVGLLLAKFLRRGGEISVRRALGARRRDVFLQLGIEAGAIGIAGGALGLGIAELGLWSVRQRPDGYAHLAQMDITMLLGTFLLAIVAGVCAGLVPAWRACNVTPALQLKTQ
ncbi:ABC transporter permease [Dyella nitratireducens]|uniref:ABC transporter ATP-binding protein n=1 Tax=Dyella nitratireducens TaxID=1849580 RepID=A0ABQ1FR86_9GAMM|nr:ABC transporter permease [Dyella nitratireducens]GGA27087.1 ABC transporter ATP-binding protein [Dyella nitratireducens]GLQ43464.1 ABC transporter ATP-binding protein [Dyella nitratireducens]